MFLAVEARAKRLQRWRWPAAAIAGVVAIGLSAYGLWVVGQYRLYQLGTGGAGSVYRSAEMPAEWLVALAQELGLRTVVDFRLASPEVDAERAALARIGVEHVHLPSNQVPSEDGVASFLELASDPARRPLLLHCKHGVGRAGVFGALYRIEFEGWSAERAVAEARRLSGYSSFGADTPKARFLRAYESRSQLAAGREQG